MSAGTDALAESARLELARVYARTSPEFHRSTQAEIDQHHVDELATRRALHRAARRRESDHQQTRTAP